VVYVTDGLISLAPVVSVVSALVDKFGGYIAVIFGVYMSLFLIGALIEAFRSSRQS
jgi:hypothetical protein